MPDGNITNTSDRKINPELSYFCTKTRTEFKRSCLKLDKITYPHGKIVTIYVVYETSKNYNISCYSTLENCLFRAVSLTKNADIDEYNYSGYGIGFDMHECFSHPSVENGRNIIVFGLAMSSSTKINNRKRDILILGEGPTQRLEHTLSAEKIYSINFTENNNKFCLSLCYHGRNSYLFVNGKEIHQFKAII